jgi:2-polyprenyl-6-methoxyphenol hydroxylase-like FAD-dependent oxidoreductase
MKALIIGGGIGGLAMSLYLHKRGIACEVFEQSPEINELGVGINTLPHAIKELADLGLLDALDKVAIRTHELIYVNRFGQVILAEPRGLEAGYDVPQFSIHRGRLQGVLHEASRDRIGPENIHTGHRLTHFEQDDGSVTAHFAGPDGQALEPVRGDLLIAADGIHSAVRKQMYPDEGPPSWNGIMLWRGACHWPKFLTGRSMVIAGGMAEKVVLYPIAEIDGEPDKRLTNWAVQLALYPADGSVPPPRREDWNRVGRLDDLLPHVQRFSIPYMDVIGLIEATETFYEYPMCDRDPLPFWSEGRVTMLGDAAHSMYPVGSNGASQAVLDAKALVRCLEAHDSVPAALKAYQDDRLPKTAEIVRTNRLGGPERIVDVVAERAPDGFDKLEDVIDAQEIEAITKGYQKLAGFDKQSVKGKPK